MNEQELNEKLEYLGLPTYGTFEERQKRLEANMVHIKPAEVEPKEPEAEAPKRLPINANIADMRFTRRGRPAKK